MVKTLTVNSSYEPSKRSFNWLKFQAEENNDRGHELADDAEGAYEDERPEADARACFAAECGAQIGREYRCDRLLLDLRIFQCPTVRPLFRSGLL